MFSDGIFLRKVANDCSRQMGKTNLVDGVSVDRACSRPAKRETK